MIPKPAETWSHFKGNHYVVVGVSRDSEAWSDESKRVVVYFRADKPPGEKPILIHRPLSMWMEVVDRPEHQHHGPRFTKLKDAPNINPCKL